MCSSLSAAQQNDGIILTQPGNLKCKKILHLVGQTDLVKITKVVKDALQTCLRNSLTSVAFPAIGTGHYWSLIHSNLLCTTTAQVQSFPFCFRSRKRRSEVCRRRHARRSDRRPDEKPDQFTEDRPSGDFSETDAERLPRQSAAEECRRREGQTGERWRGLGPFQT